MINWKSKRQEIFCTEFLPSIIMAVICVICYFILNIFPDRFPSRIHCFSTAALYFIPCLFYLAFKLRFPPILKIIGFGFITCGMLLATGMSLYDYIPNWDTILHTASGLMCFLFAYYFLIASGIIYHIKESTAIILALVINAATSSLWEICEYGVDVLANSNAQHSLEEGVTDTMQDILANTIGGVAIAIVFIVDILVNHKRLVDYFTRHLSVYTKYDYRKPVELD